MGKGDNRNSRRVLNRHERQRGRKGGTLTQRGEEKKNRAKTYRKGEAQCRPEY